jgi:hypothetical protein
VDPTEGTMAGRRVREATTEGSVSQVARSHTLTFDLSRLEFCTFWGVSGQRRRHFEAGPAGLTRGFREFASVFSSVM